MPQIFRLGPYSVYFWSNEGKPLECVHVHVSPGAPAEDATKIWITMSGKCLLCHNRSRIPERTLRNMMRMIEARSAVVTQQWEEYFGEIRYFC